MVLPILDRSWKHKILLILEENDPLIYVTDVIPEPEEEDAKARHKKNQVKAKRILTYSIKDNLIPYVSELKTPKEMFDALARLYEVKNTSKKLTLRHQIRIVRMDKSDLVSTYFMRVSHMKDQLAAIGDVVDDVELVTTTLNGIPPSWNALVHGICARRKLPKFDKLWGDCTQEEARLASKAQKLNDEDNQVLVAQARKGKKCPIAKIVEEDFLIIRRKICQRLGVTTVTSYDTLQVNILTKTT